MALDLGKVPAAARERYLSVGKRYGSEDTLLQAQGTLAACAEYGKQLVGYGFSLADGARLKDAADLLVEAGVGRMTARGERKETAQATLAAKRRAKLSRQRAQVLLKGLLDQAEELGVEGKAAQIRSVLGETAFSGDEDEPLCRQLDVLHAALSDKAIEKVARERGGGETTKELSAAAAELRTRSALTTAVRGTPAETEKLDLLDGIIVLLCRAARRSARVAAKALGQPALAIAFDLSYLDRRSPADEPAPEPPPAPVG